ncbi:MAG: GDP-mannose 4,6-dehydratase [Bryobacteraceae bacterium]
MKRALITGITGQDGSYLAELLLSKGYEVHGIKRRSSSFNTGRLDQIYADWHDETSRIFLHFADLSDSGSVWKVLHDVRPDEIYNLAAQSHVRTSFDIPEYTCDITAIGALRLLESVRHLGLNTRFYQASSSEMFGSAPAPQSENTQFHPRSPYACAKLFAHGISVNYRESYGMFACSGILFNHESPRRGETFVTRKIARSAARIKLGLDNKLYLGNLDARRDWGYAPEYVEAMWRILQQDEPHDYVIGTGDSHSVRDFLDLAFERVGLNWREYVEIDPRYYRPAEVDDLRADPSLARRELGWEYRVGIRALVNIMVDAELAAPAPQNDNTQSADATRVETIDPRPTSNQASM